MDTPLYVLSTAASMVESVDISKHSNYTRIEEAALKRTLDVRESTQRGSMSPPGLPQYPDQPREGARGSDESSSSQEEQNKRCAGTQTSFSSFGGAPSEKYQKTEMSSPPTASPPSYYGNHRTSPPSQRASPPSYGYVAMDTSDDMPLNLTKSSSTHQDNVNSTTTTSRRSPPSFSSINISSSSSSSSSSHPNHAIRHNTCNNRSASVLSEVEDPEIEEHFRRSLGNKYPSFMANRASPQNGQTAEPGKTENISITGNVDDHFAKSLGATWTKLNAEKESPLSGSVDDHFAKALGDTWFKIKARTEADSHSKAFPVPL